MDDNVTKEMLSNSRPRDIFKTPRYYLYSTLGEMSIMIIKIDL